MFCMVAERGSFRLAAEDLFLTPSAISIDTEDQSSEKHPAQADVSIRRRSRPTGYFVRRGNLRRGCARFQAYTSGKLSQFSRQAIRREGHRVDLRG